jgi:hypothetical protein
VCSLLNLLVSLSVPGRPFVFPFVFCKSLCVLCSLFPLLFYSSLCCSLFVIFLPTIPAFLSSLHAFPPSPPSFPSSVPNSLPPPPPSQLLGLHCSLSPSTLSL